MYIANLSDIDNVPSLGVMIGNVQSQNVLEQINAKWGNNTVAFGLPSNPFAEHYKNFMNLVNTQLANTDRIVAGTVQAVMNPNQYRPIMSESDLALIPPCMQVPILMMPQINELFSQRRIWGWDWNPDTFPKEDTYGRLIQNGCASWDPRDPEHAPEYIEWEWRQDDPDLDWEQLEAIDQSRRWIASWIEKELGDEGTRRDPTDLNNRIRVN